MGGEKTAEQRAVALAARQLGLITSGQCAELGMTRQQIWRRTSGRLWTRLHHDLLKLAPGPVTRDQRELGALLLAGDGAALSHLSAARRLGLDVPNSSEIYVSVPRNRRVVGAPWSKVIRSDVRAEDLLRRGSWLLTREGRTLLDLAAILEPKWLRAATDSAARQSPRNLHYARRVTQAYGTHRGVGALKRLLDELEGVDEFADSALESFAQELTFFLGGRLPELHKRVYSTTGDFVAEVDLAWPEIRLALELDGWKDHAMRRAAFYRTAARKRLISLTDWEVHTLTWDDVENRRDQTLIQLQSLYSLRKRTIDALAQFADPDSAGLSP